MGQYYRAVVCNKNGGTRGSIAPVMKGGTDGEFQ